MNTIAFNFLENLHHYIISVTPALALGLVVSGFIHEFIPDNLITRYLSGKGLRPIIYTTLVGIFLPVCCIGSLPVAVTLHRRGVRLGPVLSFLVATPATSITALFVAYSLLGALTTVYLFISVAIVAILLGVLTEKFYIENGTIEDSCPCSKKIGHESLEKDKKPTCRKIWDSLRFSSKLLKEIWLEITIGLAVAALIASMDLLPKIIETYLYGIFAYLFSVVFGIVMYMCSTGSVPMVHALISKGFPPGAGLVLLILGSVTSYSTLLVIGKEFGIKTLSAYLIIITITSLILGYGYSLLI